MAGGRRALAGARSQRLFRQRRRLLLSLLLDPYTLEDLVGDSHGHATEVGNQVDTLGVTREATFYQVVSQVLSEGRSEYE